ncbi:MAG: hypothetical protein LBU95_00945 [Rikenellaceae bacterium]|nr:hypothetical protein [Rikenellaceae bacterium]
MKITKIFAALLITALSAGTAATQDHGYKTTMDPVHSHDCRNELGLSGGAIYEPASGEWGAGAHIHFFRTFAPESRWAYGVGLEQVWAGSGHVNMSLGVRYEPWPRLEIALMPGVTFGKHDDHHVDTELDHSDIHEGYRASFAAHAEVVYNLLEAGRWHFGPALDYAWTKEHDHFMLGVHAAYCF